MNARMKGSKKAIGLLIHIQNRDREEESRPGEFYVKGYRRMLQIRFSKLLKCYTTKLTRKPNKKSGKISDVQCSSGFKESRSLD